MCDELTPVQECQCWTFFLTAVVLAYSGVAAVVSAVLAAIINAIQKAQGKWVVNDGVVVLENPPSFTLPFLIIFGTIMALGVVSAISLIIANVTNCLKPRRCEYVVNHVVDL